MPPLPRSPEDEYLVAEIDEAIGQPAFGSEPAEGDGPAEGEQALSYEELEERYNAIRSRIGEQGNTIGELRRQVEELRQAQQMQAPPQEPMHDPAVQAAGLDAMTEQQRQQWLEWDDQDPWSARRWLVQQEALPLVAQAVQTVLGHVDQEVAPIREDHRASVARTMIEQLRREYGQDVIEDAREDLARMIGGDEGFYQNTTREQQLERLRMTVESIQYRRGTRQAGSPDRDRDDRGRFVSRPAPGPHHTEGGSTPGPPEREALTIEEQIKAEIDGAGPQKEDAFGKVYVPR